MKNPFVSVVIPTCHRDNFLALCLDRLAPGSQSLPFTDYEVIVTDDGSQTTAQAMVREHYNWAKWVSGPKRGPAANRNNGANSANGEWIAFTDDDCLPHQNWLQGYMDSITHGTEVYEGKTTCQKGVKSALEESPTNLSGGCLWSCNMMVSKEIFKELNGFTSQFTLPGGEDVDFRKRLITAGQQFRFVEDAVVDHPPRRRRWGKRAAIMWEMQTLLMLTGNPTLRVRGPLLWLITRIRIREILKYPVSFASLSAFVSFLVEVFYVARYANRWQRSYGPLHGRTLKSIES